MVKSLDYQKETMPEKNKDELLQKLVNETIGDCNRCKLHSTRKTIVFGEGSANAELMFIGEGPGKDEDASGRPFVGRAGQLLTSIIEKGLGIPRSDVYIANIVKCRPTVDQAGTRDRPPEDDERDACTPFLLEQIKIIQPKVIITLGNPSTRFLLKTRQGITKMRGHWQLFKDIPVMPTYHPSYVLRNGGEKSPLKRDVWNDVKMIIEYLNSGELPAELKQKQNDKLHVEKRPTHNSDQKSLF
jgi:uracil-DNA glycosylase family 4